MQTWYFIFDLETMVQVMQQWYLREDCDDIDPKIDMVFLVKVLVDQVKLLGGSSQGGGVKEVNEKGEEVVKKVNVDIQKDGTSYINTVFDTDVMKLVDIVNSSRLDNKLVNVPTEVSESGNDVVIFNEELIELGSKKWNLTVCGQFIGCSMGFNEASRKKVAQILVARLLPGIELEDIVLAVAKRIGIFLSESLSILLKYE
ncbi:hypothetical protein Tco_0670813 [Tanacetum coccineum]